MSKNIGKVTLYEVSMSLLQKSPPTTFIFLPKKLIIFNIIHFHWSFGKVVHIFLEVNQFRRRVDIKNYLCKWNITSICSRKRPQQRLFKDTCFGILLKTVFLPIDYIISIYSPERSVIIANLSVLSWKGILHSLWCLPSKITGRIRPSSDAKLSLICSEKS